MKRFVLICTIGYSILLFSGCSGCVRQIAKTATTTALVTGESVVLAVENPTVRNFTIATAAGVVLAPEIKKALSPTLDTLQRDGQFPEKIYVYVPEGNGGKFIALDQDLKVIQTQETIPVTTAGAQVKPLSGVKTIPASKLGIRKADGSIYYLKPLQREGVNQIQTEQMNSQSFKKLLQEAREQSKPATIQIQKH